MTTIPIAIVGLGKIARDQHVPAIVASDRFSFVGTVDPVAEMEGVPSYRSVEALIEALPAKAAVAICTPPAVRCRIAAAVLDRGFHVLLEKPPALRTEDVTQLEKLARQRGVTLFAAWHSREAAAVDAARNWLHDRRISSVHIDWREDIRRWHPGQEWIVEAGGFGVFDPGINALSILTSIVGRPVAVRDARLHVPANRAAPISAELNLAGPGDLPIHCEFDFLHTGHQQWDIRLETDAGLAVLSDGGARFRRPDDTEVCGANREYPRLYARLADLIVTAAVDADVAPLELCLDAMDIGRIIEAPPFDF